MILIAMTLNSLIVAASQSCSLDMRLYNGLSIQLCKTGYFNRAISKASSVYLLYKYFHVVREYIHKVYFTHFVMSNIIFMMLIKYFVNGFLFF